MSFIFNLISALLWGGILSVVFVVLLYLLMRALYSSYRFTLWNVLLLLVLWILLFAQSTMMVGAMYAKGYVDDVQELVSSIANQANGTFGQLSSAEQVEQVKQAIHDELPAVSSYIDKIDVKSIADGSTGFAVGIAQVMKETINYYILRRILWITGIIIGGGILLVWMRPRMRFSIPTDMETYY